MKRRLAIILCGLLLIESLPLSVLGSTTFDLPVENASVWYTGETAGENGQYGETVDESLFVEQDEAASEGAEPAGSTEFEEVPAYTGQEGFENAENADSSGTFGNTENMDSSDAFGYTENMDSSDDYEDAGTADPSDIGVPGQESDGTEEGLQNDGIDESEDAGIIDGSTAEGSETDDFENSAGAENAETGDAADVSDTIPYEEEIAGDDVEGTFPTDPNGNTSTEASGEDVTSEYSISDEEGFAEDHPGGEGAVVEENNSFEDPVEENTILEDDGKDASSGENGSQLHPDEENQIRNPVEEELESVQTPSVDAVSDDYTSGSCGETASYRLAGDTLYIEGQGEVDSAPWRRIDNYSDKILKLSISPGIIGWWSLYDAFEGCRELREISLPDSLEYIGYAAFENCTSLTRVDFPEKIEINYCAFRNCSNLSKITIHSNSTIWSNDYMNAFGGTNLHTFGPDSTYDIHLIYHEGDEYDNLSGMDFNTGRYDEDTEHYEGGLTKIVLPEGLKVLSADFGGNANLTMIKFPEGLEEIWDECFSWCESLGTLSLPKSITKIGQRSFIGCGGLRELNFQNLSNLKEIGGWAFEDCVGLMSVNLPESLEMLYDGAFKDCTQLQEVYLPNQLQEIMTETFYGCTSLDPDSKSFHWPDQLQEIDSSVFGKTTFEEIHIPEGVRELGSCVFEDNSNLKKVYIPKSNTGGGAAFERAPGLTKAGPSGPGEGAYNIILDSNLEEITGDFFENSSLESIRFPDNVCSLGTRTFKNCDHLTVISLPASVTCLGKELFDDCDNLRIVRLPDNIQRVEGCVFFECASLNQILFRGDAPSYFDEDAFRGANLTAFYPKGNDTWTEDVISNDYGGTVTWKEYDGSSVDHEKEREIKINHSGTGKATFYLYDENGSPLSEMPFSYVRHGEDYIEEMNSPEIMTDLHGGFQFPTPYLSCDGVEKEVDIFFDQITPLNGEKLSRDFDAGLTIHATVTPMTSVESWTLGLSKSLSTDQKKGFIDGISLGSGNSAGIMLKTNADSTKDLSLSITLSQETQQEIKNVLNPKNGISDGVSLPWSIMELKGSGTTERSMTYSTTIYNYDPSNRTQRVLIKQYLLLIYLICLSDNTCPGFGNPLLRTVIMEKLVEGEHMVFEASEEEISVKLSGSFCALKLKSASSLLGSVKLGSGKSTKTFYAGAEKDLYDVNNMKYTSGIKNSEMYSAVSSDLLPLVGVSGYQGGTSMNDLKASVSDDDSVSVSFCNYDSGFVDLVGWNDIYRYHTLWANQETGRELIKNSSLLKQNRSGAPIPALEDKYEQLINQMMDSKITWSDNEKLTHTSSWNPGFSIKPKVKDSDKPVFELNVGIGISATHGWSTEVSNGSIQEGQILTAVDSGHTVQTAVNESDRETLDKILGVDIPDIVKDLTGLYDGCGGSLSTGLSNGTASIKKVGSNWLGYIFRAKRDTASQSEAVKKAAFSSRKIYYAPAKAASAASEEEPEENIAYTVGEPYEICVNDSDGVRMDKFDEGVELTLSYTDEELQEAGLENGGRIGIYLYDEENNLYRMVESQADGNTVTGEIFESGTYLLAVSGAPRIRNLRCALSGERWKISADIRSFAGIKSISLTMDGKPVSGEEDFSTYYDSETGEFSYEDLEEGDVGSGEHEIILQAVDLQGELSEPVSYTFTRNEITLEGMSVPDEVAAGSELTIQGKLRLPQNTAAEEFDACILIDERYGTEKKENLDLGEDGSFAFTTRAPREKSQWEISLEVRDVYGSVFLFQNEDEYGRQIPWDMSVIREKRVEIENGNELIVDLLSGTVTYINVKDGMLRIPASINGVAIRKIADKAVTGTAITELVLPDSVTDIGSYVFAGQSGLTEVTMSKKLIRVGEQAFYNCSNLMEIDLPDSVKEIGKEAFGYCINTDDWETSIKVTGFSLTGGENSEAVQEYRRKYYGEEETRQFVTKITLSKNSVSILKGRTVALEAEVEPASAKDRTVSWESSDTKIATVTSDGSVKGVGKGTATITATARDGSGVSASCEVTVKQPVTKITLSKTSVGLMKGKTITIKATAAPTTANNKAVTWTSSNKKVATVTSSGIVKGITKGTATITATARDGSGVKAVCKVTVKQPVTKITLSKTAVSLMKGKSVTLKATVAPTTANNKAMTWTSSNKKVATVDAYGKVKAVSKGTVTIIATAKDGSGVKAACKVVVKQPVMKITLDKKATTVSKGKTITLKATVAPSNANNKTVKWTTSNKSIATVTAKGVVKGIKKGTVTITATAADGSGKKATCKVTVK